MVHRSKYILRFIWTIIFILGIYIICFGVKNFSKDIFNDISCDIQEGILKNSMYMGTKMLFPVVDCAVSEEEELPNKVANLFSAYRYLHPYSYEVINESDDLKTEQVKPDSDNIDDVIAIVAENIESKTDGYGQDIENTDKMEYENEEKILEAMQKENEAAMSQQSSDEESQESLSAVTQNIESGVDTDKEVKGIEYDAQTLDFDFLMNNFYTVDSTTKASKEQLDALKLLEMDMTLKSDASSPQILIYHTHSQEGFVDSKENDSSTTVVGVGEYLAKLLREKYGYNVLHDTTSYDLIDGKIDRNKAYSLACASVSKILKENPGIEVVIDLHRDGIEGEKLVTDIDGKQTAKIMFFNGLSYTNKNGQIGYLENPYIEENLSFSLKLQIEAAKYYPGLMRKIYLKGYRYNLHLKPKALLVEVGAQNNTLQEELNAMEPLADILARVLSGAN